VSIRRTLRYGVISKTTPLLLCRAYGTRRQPMNQPFVLRDASKWM
jgi:hypothetical protein